MEVQPTKKAADAAESLAKWARQLTGDADWFEDPQGIQRCTRPESEKASKVIPLVKALRINAKRYMFILKIVGPSTTSLPAISPKAMFPGTIIPLCSSPTATINGLSVQIAVQIHIEMTSQVVVEEGETLYILAMFTKAE